MAISMMFKGALLGAIALILAACASPVHNGTGERIPDPPSSGFREAAKTPTDEVKQCIAHSAFINGAQLKGRPLTVVADRLEDQTGKENYSEDGTGKFLPQGVGSKVAQLLTELRGRSGQRLFKSPNFMYTRMLELTATLGANTGAQWAHNTIVSNVADYVITGNSGNAASPTSSGGFSFRIMGIGPDFRYGGVQMDTLIFLTEGNYQYGRTDFISAAEYNAQVQFSQAGIGGGHIFGETMVSGDIGGKDLELAQTTAGELVEFSAMKLVLDIPEVVVDEGCRTMFEKIAQGEAVTFSKEWLTGKLTRKTRDGEIIYVQEAGPDMVKREQTPNKVLTPLIPPTS